MNLVLLLTWVILCKSTYAHYFEEQFDGNWEERWVQSEHKDDLGKFQLSAGKFYGDSKNDKGIQTSEDAKFYGLSSKFEEFSNKDQHLVTQFTVKHEQGIDCGGGYVKLFPCEFDQKAMHGETPYNIMFGPDICGGTKKVHVILTYEGKNHLIKKEIKPKDDVYTHLYTLVLAPENKYEVLIDNERVESGLLEEDWEILPPKKVKDPEANKPDDWVDNAKIDDPEDSKPADWDKPEHIPDPSASMPDDWDEEMDGEWEPPMIDNPDYRGEWSPKQIDNPDYKGPWIHPQIDNPEYEADDNLYAYDSFCGVGFDLWQVKSGTIFDNILITNDVEAAKKQGDDLWKMTSKGEKAMKEEQEKEEKNKEGNTVDDEENNDTADDEYDGQDDDNEAEDTTGNERDEL